MRNSRRDFLALAGMAPIALLAAKGAQAAEVCYDPAALPLSQKNRRRGLGYLEASPEPAKRRCGICVFFTPTAGKEGCGNCQMLSGGPVNAGGVCNSFAPKK
jgi:hypothetical protein